MANKRKLSPLFPDLRTFYVLSYIIALLLIVASLSGILFPEKFYPSWELHKTFLTNDYINLIIGLPGIFLCSWASNRGVISGLLCWPGVILYILYNYIAYAIAMTSEPLFLVYLALIILSVFSLIFFVKNVGQTSIAEKLLKSVPGKLSGWILTVFGSIFFIRASALFLSALIEGTRLQISELAVNGADFIITPLWIISGISLIGKKAFGYISGLAVLLQGCLLFAGLLLLLIIQPIITMTAFIPSDFIVIALMGSIFFIPTFLYFKKVE